MQAPVAAAYMGVSPSTFHSRVKEGEYPAPIIDGGNRLWDRKRLDELRDIQSGMKETGKW